VTMYRKCSALIAAAVRDYLLTCSKGDDQSQWRRANFDPPPATHKPLNRSSPKFAQVIRSATATNPQNLV